MNIRFLLLALMIGGIVAAEILLWTLFRAKAVPLSFPHEKDASSLRFFTFARLRFLAAAHTIFLLGIVTVIFLFAW